MAEQLANLAQTTLAKALSVVTAGTSETIIVASTAKFPTEGNFRINLGGGELGLVTNVSGVKWTVTRGVENTTPTSHPVGQIVTSVLTVASLHESFDRAGAAAAAQAIAETAAASGTAVEKTRAETAEAGRLAKTENLKDLANTAIARANLGLGSAAVEPVSAFDAKGAAATAQAAAESASDAKGLAAVEKTRAETAEATLIPLSQRGAANGVATLDAKGILPTSQLPSLALTDPYVVHTEAEQLALETHKGDFAIRTDLGKTFVQNGGTAKTMADWTEIVTPGDVTSVNGQTGTVNLTAASVGADASGAAAAAEAKSIPLAQRGAAGGVATLDSEDHLTVAQLPPSVVSGSSTGGPLAWKAATAYIVNEVVTSGEVTYICLKAHTSGETFSGAGTNWAAVAGAAITTRGLASPVEFGAQGGEVDDTAAYTALINFINILPKFYSGILIPFTSQIKSGNLPVIRVPCQIIFAGTAELDFSQNFTNTRGLCIEGTANEMHELTESASQGTYVIKAPVSYPDGTIIQVQDPTTIWDPLGTGTHPGEFVEVGRPDGMFSGINGSSNTAKINVGNKLTAITITNVNPTNPTSIWPETGQLELGEEVLTYTSRELISNGVKFTLEEHEALHEYNQGFRVVLKAPEGTIYLRQPISHEKGYTTGQKSRVGSVNVVPDVRIENLRIKGPLFGVGITGLKLVYCYAAYVESPRFTDCWNRGWETVGCIAPRIIAPWTKNSREINMGLAGGAGYGGNLAEGTQDAVVIGGWSHRTRHAVTQGSGGGNMLARRNKVIGHIAEGAWADAFDSHGGAADMTLEGCIAFQPNGAGANMNCPKATVKNCSFQRPGTNGVQGSYQGIGTTEYDFDAEVISPGGGGFAVGAATYRKVEKVTTTEKSFALKAEAGKKVFKASDVGSAITGTGIPSGTTITAVNSEEEVTVGKEATASGTVTVAIAIGQNVRRVRIRGSVDGPVQSAVAVAGAGEGNAIAYEIPNVDIDVQVSNGPTSAPYQPFFVAAATYAHIKGKAMGVAKGNELVKLRDVKQFVVDLGPCGWTESSTVPGVNVIVGAGGEAGGSTKGVIREGPMFNRGKASTKLDNNTTHITVYPGPDENVELGTGTGNVKK